MGTGTQGTGGAAGVVDAGAGGDAGDVGDASGAGGTGGSGSGGSGGIPGTDAGRDAGSVDARIGPDAPPLTANVTIHIAGDSTAAIFPVTDTRVGWGAVFQQFFTTGVTVDDAARSGRSTKSFIDEGWWTALKAQIRPGDYVFIQFAHNDEKIDDPLRYTDPATTFRDNLRFFIADSRSAGGFPVLLTPNSRRDFSGSTIVNTHGAYPAATMAVGQETGTPVIDMTERTRVLLENLGPQASIPLYAADDNTHTSAQGAPVVARLVVDGIRELQLPLVQRLAP